MEATPAHKVQVATVGPRESPEALATDMNKVLHTLAEESGANKHKPVVILSIHYFTYQQRNAAGMPATLFSAMVAVKLP